MPLDLYERRASECLRFAQKSSNPDGRSAWRNLALCWQRLSTHAEELRDFATARNVPAAHAADKQGGTSR
jgi:hypothetical protein